MPTTNFQQFADFSNQGFYVGIDVHKKSWSVTIRSVNLEVDHFNQPPSADALYSHLKKKFPGGSYYSVYEAGYFGTTIHEQLCRLGIKNIITNPADIPMTDKQKKTKTDLHDSRSLAENLERGALKGISILSREEQELRALFRLRVSKSRDLTRATNRIKGFLTYFGVELPSSWDRAGYLSKRVIQWLQKLELGTSPGTFCLQENLQEILYRRGRLLLVTTQLRNLVQAYYPRQYECLISVPGIGPLTAIALLAEVGDFSRFDSPDQFCSFLGLLPWEHSSGETLKTQGLQPRCNRYLRPAIIEASWMAVRKSPELLLYYRKHAVRNSKQAIVKVARKLALIARGVVLRKELYNPEYNNKQHTGKTRLKTRRVKRMIE